MAEITTTAGLRARKFYVRYREDLPETEMQYAAVLGFRELGVEVAPFRGFGDVEQIDDFGPDVGVAGYVGDVWRGLARLGRPRPEPVDYPEELRELLRREVRRATLADVRRTVARVHVKPVEHKLFTGFVWRGAHDADSRLRVATYPESTPVWVSDAIDMASEYRCFVLGGEVVDVRRYRGDWWRAPDRGLVAAAVAALRSPPVAYAIDFAVLGEGSTALVEVNDGFALGHYGLRSVLYARVLAARWGELAGGAP